MQTHLLLSTDIPAKEALSFFRVKNKTRHAAPLIMQGNTTHNSEEDNREMLRENNAAFAGRACEKQ